MVRKILLLVFLLTVLILVLSWDRFFNQASAIYEMSGKIIEVKNGSIVVEGVVESSDPNISRQENRTIEFKIIDETILKKNAIVITVAQINSGESFQPETRIRPGAISDLAVDMRVFKIESKDNLFIETKAVAAEINYLTYEFPAP